MATMPGKRLERIAFCKQHGLVWTGVGDQIGTNPAAVTALVTAVTATEAGWQAVLAARDAARAAEGDFLELYGQMSEQCARLISTIRSFAKSNPATEQSTYGLAQIPAPKAPAPVPAPGIPYAPKVQLQTGGTLQLKWSCDNPRTAAGTVYEVSRQEGSGPAVALGTIGKRSFTDTSIPAGAAALTYSITAMRSTIRGIPAQFNVQFGTPAGGTMAQATVSPVRQAA
jgi:hypothetical protein